jgi:hypothetical protein
LSVLAISAGIYAASTQTEQAPPGYKWAEQRGINEEDSCSDDNRFFYQGCVPNEVDNGIGTPPPMTAMITEATG